VFTYKLNFVNFVEKQTKRERLSYWSDSFTSASDRKKEKKSFQQFN